MQAVRKSPSGCLSGPSGTFRSTFSGAFEDGDHLLVRCLGELPVGLADSLEPPRSIDDHDIIGHLAQGRDAVPWRHRYGQDHSTGARSPKGFDRRAGRVARGQPVVHEDDGAALHGDRSPLPAIAADTPRQFFLFGSRRGLQLIRPDAQVPQQGIIEDADTTFRDGTDPEFRLPRAPDLADDDDVQGRREVSCDLCRDRYATPWHPDDDRLKGGEPIEVTGELPACIVAIPEHGHSIHPGIRHPQGRTMRA